MERGINDLLNLIAESRTFREVLDSLAQGTEKVNVDGANFSGSTLLVCSLQKFLEKPVLVIVPKPDDAINFLSDLTNFVPEENLFAFPSWDTMPFESIPPVSAIIRQRLSVIENCISNAQNTITCAPIDALLQKIPQKEQYAEKRLYLSAGNRVDRDEFLRTLVEIGYKRVDIVETNGEFAVRGGIIDLFPVMLKYPVRVEFFSDIVESIREFDVIDQRSKRILNDILITPNTERYELKNNSVILDYLPVNTIICAYEPGIIEKETHDFLERFNSEHENRVFTDHFTDYTEIDNKTKNFQVLSISGLPQDNEETERFTLNFQQNTNLNGAREIIGKEFETLKNNGYSVVVLASYKNQAERIREILEQSGQESEITAELGDGIPSDKVLITDGNLRNGLRVPELLLAVYTDGEFFGHRHRRITEEKYDISSPIYSVSELKLGDYVVHVNFGIGIYRGIVTRKVIDTFRDLIQIDYANEDKLFIPVNSIDLIGRYVGEEGRVPRIYSLDGVSWNNTVGKVKKSIYHMAKELLEIYAVRSIAKGFAFSRNTEWNKELEDTFRYDETEDQTKCIGDVTCDMESDKQMDRLICGDVGFGKTEVAVRASFKAVLNGKQVALLSPTTILAQQHFNTFSERLSSFPIKVEMISRFRTKLQQENIISAVKKGVIDVIIGTHRLLSSDVEFSNLGLLIIDEEQKFGVRHKEKIKKMRRTVDVLTLSATPIPRTLYLSLSGIREMSVINTPPENRLPIEVVVTKFSKETISSAVSRELKRGGQAYFIFNRVETINQMASYLKKILPDVRIAVAHGQLSARELETIMINFLNRKYDMLVCTTIIESGIDIPNVNTILVNRADTFGLSQLYQLKGRVGRSSQKAYAYLFHPGDHAMTEDARKRLVAIKEFSALGSGYHIAVRDMEIRGAGNVLGSEQHGHMLLIGFEMYCKLLNRAINELKGIKQEEEIPAFIDLNINSYVPTNYVADEKMRMYLYKRISIVKNDEDAKLSIDEITDRFGRPPESVLNLIDIALIKHIATKKGIVSIRNENDNLIIEFKDYVNYPKILNSFGKKYKLIFNKFLPRKLIIRHIGKDNTINILKDFLASV